MDTLKTLLRTASLIAFALSLPVAAEESVPPQLKEHFGLQPAAVKTTMPVKHEASKATVLEAKQPTAAQSELTPAAGNIPYVTYEGAENVGK